jgi:hypothetical protein
MSKEGEAKQIPLLRHYTVFNLKQCTGVEAPAMADMGPFTPIEICEKAVGNMPQRPMIVHGEPRAYYRPGSDSINTPRPKLFDGAENLEAFIRRATAESLRLKEPEAAVPVEPAPAVDCVKILLALVRALLPDGQQVYLRNRGLTALPLDALKALLAPEGSTMHAAKVRDARRSVTCTDVYGRIEHYGVFEVRAID